VPTDLPPEGEAIERSRDHRRGVRQACADLERSIARPASPGAAIWSESVARALAELASAFARHVKESESPEGLLKDITSVAPRLQHAVDHVRHEHVEIVGQIDHVKSLAVDNEDADRIPMIREESLALLQSISAHRYRGAELVYDAYTVDIEAAD
jgi:hypothetical protein